MVFGNNDVGLFVELQVVVSVTVLIFCVGLYGVFVCRGNLVIVILSTELMILGSIINYVVAGLWFGDIESQVAALAMMTIAASESVLFFSYLIVYDKGRVV